MLTEKDYYFIVMVTPEGYQFPLIKYALKEGDFLSQLVYTQNLQRSEGVRAALKKIDNVLQGKKDIEEIWETECEMPCFLEIRKDISIIGDAYTQDEELAFRLDTIELKKMFEKWLDFLVLYESNGIPNLTYNYKK